MNILEKPRVSIVRNHNIKTAVRECLDRLKLPDLNGQNILLKPNVGRETDPKLGINTNPEVVKAVFNYLQAHFQAKFFIGDSPIINTATRKAFKQSGYSELLSNQNLKFLDLDEPSPIEREIPEGLLLKKIKLTGYLDQIDYIISIPVLKMHMHCGVSLGFKNLKGLIYRREKIKLHHLQNQELINKLKINIKKIKELDIAIADLIHVLKPDLVVIDASYAQGGMGPSSGDRVKMDTIMASTHPIAADIVALALTQPEWTLYDVPHLKLISESLKPPVRSINDIKTTPDNIQDFITPLDPPPSSISIKYNNVNLIDIDSCSACLSTVFNLLKNNKEFLDMNFTQEKPLNLAIGKGLKSEDLYEDTYLIGNCTYEQRQEGIFIKGCTPVESTILKVIKENLKKNT